MNAREAIKAMLDDKKVRAKNDEPGFYLELGTDGHLYGSSGMRWERLDTLLGSFYANVVFEIFEEPATDEQLIAEMERLGETQLSSEQVAQRCAEMLKTRKVKP